MLGDISFLQYTTILWILALAYFILTRIIKPYRQYCFYKSLVSANYKTYVYPFSLIPIGHMNQPKTDLQKHGDSQYTVKYFFRQYQVIVQMLQDQVYIDLIDPHLIKQFYQRVADWCYIKSDKGFFVIPFGEVLGNGLILSEQHLWRSKRKIMSNVFNYDFIKSKVGIISKIAKETLDKFEEKHKNASQKQVQFNLNSALQQMFGNVVIKCFFGDIHLLDIKGEPIFHFFNRLIQLNVQRSRTAFAVIFSPKFFKYNLRPIDRQVNKMTKQFNEYASQIINDQIEALSNNKSKEGDENSQNNKINGVIQLLVRSGKLQRQDHNQKKEMKTEPTSYSTKELVDEFKTFFFAGNDSTSNYTTVLVYTITKQKDIMEKVRQQIDEVIGDDLSNITYQKLKQLKYMDKVQKQTLRMFGPSTGIFKREAVKDHYIGSIPIKKGMIVKIQIDSNHFKQQFYKNPQTFNPDRWDTFDATKADPYVFFPFSAGQRNCIGQHLALLESKIALVHLLKRYKEIRPQKTEFRLFFRTTYGAESMNTTFIK